jgi:hypothetical protein
MFGSENVKSGPLEFMEKSKLDQNCANNVFLKLFSYLDHPF